MKRILLVGLAMVVFASVLSHRLTAQNSSDRHTITLYSPLQYNHDASRSAVNFQSAAYARPNLGGDVGYGFGRIGTEFDWLQSSLGPTNRSVILDLGGHVWTDNLKVPWVEPRPRLKPGEKRQFVIDASGKDGCDGLPGADGMDGRDGFDASQPSAVDTTPGIKERPRSVDPCKGKRDATIRTSPDTLRAILGHMYVIHVVDDEHDYYALFRIDALQRGDNCTISWKIIPPPQPTTVKK